MSLIKVPLFKLLIATVLLSFASTSSADQLKEFGEGRIYIKKKTPSPQEYRAVLYTASLNALETWVARDQQRQKAYQRCIAPDIQTNLNKYILSVSEREPEINKKRLELKQKAIVFINENGFNTALSDCAGKGLRNRIAFVFVSREQKKGGGYQIPKTNNEVENSLKAIFKNNDFSVTSNNRLEHYSGTAYRKDRLEKDYLRDGDLNWLPAERAAELLGVDFFAFGTVDIRVPYQDEDTGLWRASAVVSAELTDLANIDSLAVDGPTQASAISKTPEQAVIDASKLALEKTANKMIAQLNGSGIR